MNKENKKTILTKEELEEMGFDEGLSFQEEGITLEEYEKTMEYVGDVHYKKKG